MPVNANKVDISPAPVRARRPCLGRNRGGSSRSPRRQFPQRRLLHAHKRGVPSDNRLKPVFIRPSEPVATQPSLDPLLDGGLHLFKGPHGQRLSCLHEGGRRRIGAEMDASPYVETALRSFDRQDLLTHAVPRPLALPMAGVKELILGRPFNQVKYIPPSLAQIDCRSRASKFVREILTSLQDRGDAADRVLPRG